MELTRICHAVISRRLRVWSLTHPPDLREWKARLADVRPSAFAIDGQASEAVGVIDAWFNFETAVARGRGHLRLRDGKAWTFLTTMTELKGFEEHTHERRIKGAEHGAQRGRKSWLEKRQDEEATPGFSE